MKYFLFFLILFLYSCGKPKSVLICGDHKCVNKSEAKQYFEENLSIEVKIIDKKDEREFDLVELNLKESSNKNKKISISSKTKTNQKIKMLSKKEIVKIKDLANKWDNYHDTKESCELNNYMTWTERGWTKVQRVIRHKFDSKNKKLLKISTHTGVVVVTDEHSLLDENKNIIDASRVSVGSKLLHSFPEIIDNETNLSNIRCGDVELELSEETATTT